jgi:nitric oxide reductase subunit B
MRVPGDVVFSIGVACLALFAWRLVVKGKRGRPALAPVRA